MKLLFTIPEGNPNNIFASDLINAWLKYNRVFFGERIKVSYNTVCDFYDCYIYRYGESDSAWDSIYNDLGALKEVTHVEKTWTVYQDRIDAIRFWIQCDNAN